MRALVTGGAGFIGSTLVDALVARGDAVTCVDNLVNGNRAHVNPDAEFVELDVTDPSLAQVIKRCNPTVVFHLAAQIDVRISVADPVEDARANVLGTVNVLSGCAEAAVRRVVFASSGGAIYGEASVVPTPETQPVGPVSAYGAAKLSCEVYGEAFSRCYGTEFVALRYANVYGPRQGSRGDGGVVSIFFTRAQQGLTVTIYGDGEQTRDYVYVGDVVDATMRAADGPTGTFNIGTGVATSVNHLHRWISEIAEGKSDRVYGPRRAGELERSCLNSDRAREQLGWTPRVALREGLERTAASILPQRA